MSSGCTSLYLLVWPGGLSVEDLQNSLKQQLQSHTADQVKMEYSPRFPLTLTENLLASWCDAAYVHCRMVPISFCQSKSLRLRNSSAQGCLPIASCTISCLHNHKLMTSSTSPWRLASSADLLCAAACHVSLYHNTCLHHIYSRTRTVDMNSTAAHGL